RGTLGGEKTAFWRLRHVEQDLCIVNHLLHFNMLSRTALSNSVATTETPQDSSTSTSTSSPVTYVEFGAGKGLLTRSIHVVNPRARFVLIERSGGRRRADRFLTNSEVHRLRMDIRHCQLAFLPAIQTFTQGQVVCVAKHLCGVASDLAIRSLSHLTHPPLSRGVMIATCCHHVCNYADYVGRDWLREAGTWSGAMRMSLMRPGGTGCVVC
ncbi:MAG: hypothetical protein EOP84_28380, partial [Verrucomicrobiaceae bacterium]